MRSGSLTFVVGGAASGKSEFAEKIVAKFGRRILYLATAGASRSTRTAEWRGKIDRHQTRRPADWETFVLNGGSIRSDVFHKRLDGILLDSLTLWVSNRVRIRTAEDMQDDLASLIGELRRGPVVVVSDEVGMGLIPMSKISRRFIEHLGLANAWMSRTADAMYVILSGQAIRIK